MATNLMIFSDDMIDEILSRLPPKSLLRFRCLSRSMCSKIDSEKFTKLHLNHSLKSDPSETLIISGYGHVRLVEHRLTTPKVRRLTLPVDPTGSNVRICGSCNGLVALHIDKPGAGDVVVWNPFTDKHKMLPAPGIRPMWPKALGFGYDPLTRDYKQVRIDYEGNYLPYVAQFRVFSFRSNTWRKVNGPPFRVSINIDRRYGVSFSGALHFAIATSDQPDGDSIMAFDLHTENFRVLTGLPRYGVDGSFQDVQVLRGQLCVIFGLANTSEIEAWAMTDYGREEESWTMLLRVSLSSSLFGELSCLLDYSENPRKFLVHGRFSGPVWVDSERKTEEVVTQLRIWPRAWDATSMAGTLVSVDGLFGEPE